ncbi:Hypothetical predicted protein [Mytilus galloprovincialis]|uniref:Sushi domain-containing protein n=1 Tax=Mytilus galloprovincialis TaxID=29158 RepID=A0A8B6HGS7_MYTGA|nr:Hypothetical predicted protein [Mytilus galloprovincialis]
MGDTMEQITNMECIDFRFLPRTNTSHTPDALLSTTQRTVGQKVYLTCPEDYKLIGRDMITCLSSGKWNVEAQPHCTDETFAMSDSTKLYIGVFCACGALFLFAVTILIAKLTCFSDKELRRRRTDGLGTQSVDSMTYVHDIKDHPPAVISVVEDGSEVGIIRPFETFINPAYYQQPRPRLSSHSRSTGSTLESEADYDAPWSTGSPDERQCCHTNTNCHEPVDRRWSDRSIKAMNNYDYERYGRIPRINPNNAPVFELPEDDQTPF